VGWISLSGIDPKAASETDTRLSLLAIYTNTKTYTRSATNYERVKNGDRLEFIQEDDRISALAQLDRHARLVLLGDPGSGKSAFVNFVALCMAGEILGRDDANLHYLTELLPQENRLQAWTHGALLPVRVILRDFAARGLPQTGERATMKHLWGFIVSELEDMGLGNYEGFMAQRLREEGGLLLLDGLDEVPEAERRREQIKQAVEGFAAAFPKCRILVTARTYAYQSQAWRLAGFEEAVLAPFDLGQIQYFVDRWYTHIAQLRRLHRDDAQGRAELLKQAIRSSERLQALAGRPLLLTLMASLHAWRGGSLPERRESLYADTVDLLLDWWESPKVVHDAEGSPVLRQPSLAEWLRVDRERVRNLLERLAYEAHAGQLDLVGTADVLEDELVRDLLRVSQNPDVRPQRLVQYLGQRTGLLTPRGVGVYTFPHRTLQEYLAACHLTGYEYPDKVAELARSDPNRWREVALLSGAKAARGTASAVWSLVDALCYRYLSEYESQSDPDAWGALVAGQALVENADLERISERNQAKVERVRTHLVHIMEKGKLPAVDRTAVGRVLAKLGDPRRGVGLREDGLPDIVWCEVPAGPFMMESIDEDEIAHSNEKPQHEYEIEQPYAISRYPVTNAQYAAFVQVGGYTERRYWTEAGWAWREDQDISDPEDYGAPFNLPNHPVVGVSWLESLAFCCWLTERLRERGQIDRDQEIGLPTEPQWEKAAHGEDRRSYPWGDDPSPDRANYADTGIGTTSAAGCFPGGASPYGVLDLSGNVWEWCSPYHSYPHDSSDARRDMEDNIECAVRGGSYQESFEIIRCSSRQQLTAGYRAPDVGFRIVVLTKKIRY
jgi:formylglycine-generating enzyme required for sulfatase activity